MSTQHDHSGTSRRQFLVRSGVAAAWAVPAVQVVTMTAASAQVHSTTCVPDATRLCDTGAESGNLAAWGAAAVVAGAGLTAVAAKRRSDAVDPADGLPPVAG